MGYLDEEGFRWEVDPEAKGTSSDDLPGMMEQLAEAGPDASLFVLEGFRRLKGAQPQATDADCFHTSMIWWFG